MIALRSELTFAGAKSLLRTRVSLNVVRPCWERWILQENFLARGWYGVIRLANGSRCHSDPAQSRTNLHFPVTAVVTKSPQLISVADRLIAKLDSSLDAHCPWNVQGRLRLIRACGSSDEISLLAHDSTRQRGQVPCARTNPYSAVLVVQFDVANGRYSEPIPAAAHQRAARRARGLSNGRREVWRLGATEMQFGRDRLQGRGLPRRGGCAPGAPNGDQGRSENTGAKHADPRMPSYARRISARA
jgi:hypothetical protein